MLLIFGVLLTGCGTIQDEFHQATQAEDVYLPVEDCPMRALARTHEMTFTGYLKQFQKMARVYDVGCYKTKQMYFDDKMPSDITVAYCVPGERVVVSRKKWETLEPIEKKVLIFHELGHCALNMDHTSKDSVDIMTPELLDPELASDNWGYLVGELFTRARGMQGK